MIPINKNAVKAGGNTIMELRLSSAIGSAKLSNTTEALSPYIYITSWVPETRLARVCDDKDNYRFGFNGKEKDNEVKGIGNHYNFDGYGLDVRVGRRLQLDPETAAMPSFSSYSVFQNNPIFFIDPSGRIPYPITIRAFAPFKVFGFGYHGDDRGYSTADKTARVHQRINFDTDKPQITTVAWSSPTWKVSNSSYKKTGIPSVKFEGRFTTKTDGDNKTFNFGSHVAGSNPIPKPQALVPNIDVFSKFSITENKKEGTLRVSGSLKGDNFPSTEAFITDPSGKSVFVGIGQISAGVGRNTGPFTELPGENKDKQVADFDFTISTDKQGNFTGVKEGGKSYSLEDWNKKFETQPTQKQ